MEMIWLVKNVGETHTFAHTCAGSQRPRQSATENFWKNEKKIHAHRSSRQERTMNSRQRTPEQNERVEQLAKDMHRHYRAAFKALHEPASIVSCGGNHDHGWEHCHGKRYFRQRAVKEL